tara:strand:- start:371 stop:529 length:159 start_codon:yes stop_codon:yes gene_type:complete
MTEGTRANQPYKPSKSEKEATNELYKKWGLKPPFTEKAKGADEKIWERGHRV